ncbi:MAG TPA: SDR family NAD(P)-dependent oxidoreductase [Afifellaceae bacterium]|nr:SDR family NAD(P)-dependent oxidoreductase [Afifellaceae bacterium]
MEERPLPIAGDAAVMAEYFETMRRFLETQENVMSMLTGNQSAIGRSIQHRARRTTTMNASADAVPALAIPNLRADPVDIPTKPAAATAPSETTRASGNGANGANGSQVAIMAATTPSTPDEPSAQAGQVDREKMTDMLLTVVEETTGYPRDMVGLDQNLESDLGIDSIKRIEVVGNMLRTLPENYANALGEDRSQLNTQPTLNGMLDILSALAVEGAANGPFDQAGTGSRSAVAGRPFRQNPRYSIVAAQEAIVEDAMRRLNPGHFLVTQDAVGVTESLTSQLADRGCTFTVISAETVADADALLDWVSQWKPDHQSVAGIVHLTQLSAEWLDINASLDTWRTQLQCNEKSLFVLLRELNDILADDAHVLTASALGGTFGRSPNTARGLSMQGGGVGALKSIYEECPSLRVKAVDVDLSLSPERIGSILLEEMKLLGGPQEVGYPQGDLTVFRTVEADVEAAGIRADSLQNAVILATGGARGVTAEVLRELALPGNTLVLIGRHPLPAADPSCFAALSTADELRQHYISQVRAGESSLKPAEIGRKVNAILAARELRANLEDFRRAGATIEYHAVDATDEHAMHSLLESMYERFGSITGVVHGAGVIEDKLLADKTDGSWSRVVETKVFGLLLLQRYLRPESLKFFSVFSSVAGRYGNSGQSDYATANELMNRLCCQLRDQWDNKVNVKAFCWGPWGPTKFGAGMVTAETQAKFADKGVALVTAEAGRRMFLDELCNEDVTNVEIVCGEGPWEEREAAKGKIERQNSVVTQKIAGPFLYCGVSSNSPQGEQQIRFLLDSNHSYLDQHRIDGVPILPAAAAMEIMAEAVGALWPGWKVVEVSNCRLLKGIEVRQGGLELNVIVSPPTYGSSDGFDVNVTLRSESDDGKPLSHYRTVLRLAQQMPPNFQYSPNLHAEKSLTTTKAYDEWLFHGPCFQVLNSIEGLSASGARAVVSATQPKQWFINGSAEHSSWLFDPAVVDSAPQMAILWARAYRNATALPTRFGRLIRYQETLPETMHMGFECIESPDPNIVQANVYYTDGDDQVVLLIEDMECVASTALNRLGGTSEFSESVSA